MLVGKIPGRQLTLHPEIRVRVLAFRHVPFESLGLIEPALESRGIGFD